jgi:hypothetical protein
LKKWVNSGNLELIWSAVIHYRFGLPRQRHFFLCRHRQGGRTPCFSCRLPLIAVEIESGVSHAAHIARGPNSN